MKLIFSRLDRHPKAALYAAFLVGAAVLAALLIPFPAVQATKLRPALFRDLENLCHPIVFGALTWLVLKVLRSAQGKVRLGDALWLLVAMTAFGAATEVLQHFTGRDASWSDLVGDFIGASFALTWAVWPRRPMRFVLLVALGAAACAPLCWTLAAYAYRSQQLPLLWRADSELLGEFAIWGEGDYPGLALKEVPPDWRAYRELLITVENPHSASNTFVVRVDDVHHNQQYEDRFNRRFEVPPQTKQTFSIRLEEIRGSLAGRSMDMRAITGVIVFQVNEPALQRVNILRISLKR